MIKVKLSRGDDAYTQIHESLRVLSDIDFSFNKKEIIKLDFTDVEWILPCAVMLISGKIKEVITNGAEFIFIPPRNIKINQWLVNVGFPLGDNSFFKEDSTFIPLKFFSNDVNNISQVNQVAITLIKELEKRLPISFKDSIKVILAELSDNIDQHSQFSFASLMAQYYPSKEYLDLAVYDNGISIPYNFENNDISFDFDSRAIMKALNGEVSTRKNELMRGFGLRSCKNISINGINGELHILSRKGLVILRDQMKPEYHDFEKTRLQGTLLYFRLPTPKEEFNIYPYLE